MSWSISGIFDIVKSALQVISFREVYNRNCKNSWVDDDKIRGIRGNTSDEDLSIFVP